MLARHQADIAESSDQVIQLRASSQVISFLNAGCTNSATASVCTYPTEINLSDISLSTLPDHWSGRMCFIFLQFAGAGNADVQSTDSDASADIANASGSERQAEALVD